MRYFLSKLVHSCFASFSTSDVILKKEIPKADFDAIRKLLPNNEQTVGDKYGFTILYVEDDETFGNIAFHRGGGMSDYEDTPEFKKLIRDYKKQGWKEKIAWLDSRQRKFWEDERIARIEQRTKEGYVIPEWSKDILPEKYQGGFSDAVFNEPMLQNYLQNGGVWGYIGHSCRKPEIDAYIERKFNEYQGLFLKAKSASFLKPNDAVINRVLAGWLTSSDGRHFGDSIECADDWQKYIDENVIYCVERGIEYLEEK